MEKLLAGIQDGGGAVEKSLALPQKAKHRITVWLSNFPRKHIPEGTKSRNLTRCLYTSIHCLIIHISQKVETIQMSINKCMDKQTMVYMVNRILFNHKKNLKRNEVLTHATTLHEPWKHNAKWNKPDVCVLAAQSRPALCNPMDSSPPDPLVFRPWSFPGKNTGKSCHSLLQGIFLTQGSNPSLSHCRQILYHWSH